VHLERDAERLGAGVDDEAVKGRAGLVDEHVADLEEVGLEPRQRERVHAVAEVVPHSGMVVLVEVADGDPLAEEGGVEEAHEPATAANRRGRVGGGGDLPRRLLRPEAQAPQPEKPHHGRRALGPNSINKPYSPPPPPPPTSTRLPPPLTTITSRRGVAQSSTPDPQQQPPNPNPCLRTALRSGASQTLASKSRPDSQREAAESGEAGGESTGDRPRGLRWHDSTRMDLI